MRNRTYRFLRATVLFGGVFIYFAIPAMISLPAVSRLGGMFYFFGLSWAASVFFLTVFVLSIAGAGGVVRLVAMATGTAFGVLNVALAVSFLTQGAPFNTAFFTHLDLSTLRIAWTTDATRLLAVVVYLLLAPMLILAVTRPRPDRVAHAGRRLRGSIATLAAALAIVTSYPLQAIFLHQMHTQQSSDRMMAELQSINAAQTQYAEVTGAGRNIVLIYLEGIEQNYFDEKLFPGLMPNLSTLRDQSLWFGDLHQFPGTAWTIGGLVGSQCGVPLLSEGHGNSILASVDNPFRQISCFAEILKTAQYRTVFLGGATLDFAGKGQFLRDNGYDLALGVDELPKASRHKWGMFDQDLYEHAEELFDGLAAENTPFLLTLLTLDTHHPDGTPSPNCPEYASPRETMLNAVHCADLLAARFVEHIRTSKVADNTLIALVSDHLFIDGAPKPVLASRERRLTFMLLDPTRPQARHSGAATHFDIAPTVLDAAGIAGSKFPFGHSLLANEQGLAFARDLSDADFRSFRIEALAAESNLGMGVAFFPAEKRLEIGNARYYTRDAINVHYDYLLSQPSEFVALHFASPSDRYPRILSGQEEMEREIAGSDGGIVVAASNGGRTCFGARTCISGQFLGIYDVARGRLVRAADAPDVSPLRLDPDTIARLIQGS